MLKATVAKNEYENMIFKDKYEDDPKFYFYEN